MLHLRKLVAAGVTIGCVLVAVPASAEVTIAALGDSLVQGYGLKDGDGLVPQLQKYLDAHGGGVKVLNAGVSGDTSAGGLSRVDWTLTPEVNGLILALGGNDLLRGLDPAVTRANLGQTMEIAKEKGIPVLLVALGAPGNYGPAYKKEFDAIYPALARQFDATLYPGFFDALARSGDKDPLGNLMQGDGIHPNSKGVAAIVADFGPVVEKFSKEIKPR